VDGVPADVLSCEGHRISFDNQILITDVDDCAVLAKTRTNQHPRVRTAAVGKTGFQKIDWEFANREHGVRGGRKREL